MAPTDDDRPFSAEDAELDLTNGVPRFYTMRLAAPDLTVHRITRHESATLVLAVAGGHSWSLLVAPLGELVVAGEFCNDRVQGFTGARRYRHQAASGH